MAKPTMLYVSPLWPMKSGISEYSEALIWGLAKKFDLTLLVDQYLPENKKIREIFEIIQYKSGHIYSGFDHILYNFGNNPEYHSYMYEMIQKNPGYVILHDYVLYYLTVGYYASQGTLFQKIYELEGIDGILKTKESLRHNPSRDLLAHKDLAATLPLNQEILRWAKGIIVHSEYSRSKILSQVPNKDILVIQHVQTFGYRKRDMELRPYDIRTIFKKKKDMYIIGSLGFIAPSKQNALICEAVNLYNQTHKEKIYYIMIGDGDFADSYLSEYIKKTGFLDNEEFYQAASQCDIIANLRNPYSGEASGTLIQCMDLGKPCIVTDIGWFSELPDKCVIKVPTELSVEQLMHTIQEIKEGGYDKIGENAYNYIKKECDAAHIAEKILNYLIRTSNK